MADNLFSWNVNGVSVTGFSHLDEDIPCQDAHTFNVTETGTLIAAIADGAGSAKFSHIGAQAFTDAVVAGISSLPSANTFEIDIYASKIKDCVNSTKEQLVRHGEILTDAEMPEISDFHATLLVVVSNGTDGAFFHVGDGAAVGYTHGSPDTEITMTRPHNGEYSNETYFVTEEDWEDKLRITPFNGNHDIILLMSDGVTPMGMSDAKCSAPAFEKFVDPVVAYIKNNEQDRACSAVTSTLSREDVRKITPDDKTFLWAIRTSD